MNTFLEISATPVQMVKREVRIHVPWIRPYIFGARSAMWGHQPPSHMVLPQTATGLGGPAPWNGWYSRLFIRRLLGCHLSHFPCDMELMRIRYAISRAGGPGTKFSSTGACIPGPSSRMEQKIYSHLEKLLTSKDTLPLWDWTPFRRFNLPHRIRTRLGEQ